MGWELVTEVTYPAWRSYPVGARYERHTLSGPIAVWKDAPAAARELLAKTAETARAEGAVPLRGKAWVDYAPALTDNIKVELDIGRPYAATLGLGDPEVYPAALPILAYGVLLLALGVFGYVLLKMWTEAIKDLVKSAVEPGVKALMPLLLVVGGAIIAYKVLE